MKIDELAENLPEILESISPSGIFQDRRRPYNGQSWTDSGVRGMTEVKGLTMRDIADCLRIAIWESCESPDNAASIYDCDLSKCDPIAIAQNLTCNIEKMMGIFPNVPKLENAFDEIPIFEIDEDKDGC
jgi:hypothetical protein